jgi:hypothetical protein
LTWVNDGDGKRGMMNGLTQGTRHNGRPHERAEFMSPDQSTVVAVVLGLALSFSSAASAASAGEACAALVETRSALWSMIAAQGKPAQDALNDRVQKASAKLDAVLAGMTGGDAQRAADFKLV